MAVAGTVPSGRRAGVAVFPYPSAAGHPWHVSEYGTLNVNPFARERVAINRGDDLEIAARLVIYDGDATEARIAERFETFRAGALLGIAGLEQEFRRHGSHRWINASLTKQQRPGDRLGVAA